MLAENGIGETGTLKANRTDKCPIKDNGGIGKESHGTYDSDTILEIKSLLSDGMTIAL